jgi:dihydropteroate synthase
MGDMSSAPQSPAYRPPLTSPVRTIGARTFDFSTHVAVMAVVNRTPDSFYDHGATFALDAAVQACLTAEQAGAEWVDIGGAPFAPGPELSVSDELDRVLPVVEAVRERSDVVISVDTFRSDVARASIRAGANVINDTTGLQDPGIARAVADSDATLVITHSLAKPRRFFPRPHYDDVAGEIAAFLRERVAYAVGLGVPESRIVIDPGHDLNKNTLQSLELTRRLSQIAAIGLPTLAAVSNKDFIGEALDAERDKRLEGSLAAAVFAITQGARIVRMHNVAESVAAVRMTEAILGFRAPAYLKHNMGDTNE